MHALSHLRLRTKLAVPLVLSVVVLVVSIGVSAAILRERMVSDQIDKLRAVVDVSVGLAQSLENQVEANKLTREQALAQYRDAAHVMRFDAGDGYIFAQTLDNIFVIHGANPKLESTAPEAKDTNGTLLTRLITAALGNGDHGVVSYSFTTPGQTTVQSKVVFAKRFTPWNVVFAAGAGIDDLDSSFNAALWELISIGGAILIVGLVVAWPTIRDITRSLCTLNSVMSHLTHGDLEVAIPGTERRDEIGSMASAVSVFKDSLKEAAQLRADQETERARAEAVRLAP